jgi:Kef-type K+ transport system membrane component KefB
MHVFYVLLVLLLLARILGELAQRLGQPALVGELVAGILLGLVVRPFASSLPVLAGLADDEVFLALTDLGVFFLMLSAALELRPRELLQASRGAAVIAVVGAAVPLGAGWGLGWIFLPPSPDRFVQALFLGTAMSITAVPVAARILLDLGQLRSKAGQTVVSAAVFDDVIGLLLLAVLSAVLRTGSAPDPAALALLLGKVLLFFLVSGLFCLGFFRWFGRGLARWKLDETEFSALMLTGLAAAVFAEKMGLHFILGAFVAGLFFVRRDVGEDVYQDVKGKVSAVTKGFLAPIFFVSIGLHLDLSAVGSVPGFLAVFVIVAVLVKMVSGIPAWFSGLGARESLAVGVAMSSRGAVELVVADIALRAGLFSGPEPRPPLIEHMFSCVVIMAVVTTLVPPFLLRRLLPPRRPEENPGER